MQDNANVGGGAGIHHFVVIGTCAFVGAMARVSMDVPPFMIVEGNPAEVRGHNHIAMARRGFTETDIEAMKEAYKRLFRDRGGSHAEKVSGLMAKYPGVRSVEILVNAVNAQARGVHALHTTRERVNQRAHVGARQLGPPERCPVAVRR